MIVEALFDFFDPSAFSLAAALFILGFIVWELPRSMKIIAEEYTEGFYPEMGRVFDFILLFIGLLALVFLYFMDGMEEVVDFLRYAALMPLFAIIIIAIPLLIFMGYLKRFFGRIDRHESLTIFAVHGILDLAHVVFFISFTIILVPILLYLLFGWM